VGSGSGLGSGSELPEPVKSSTLSEPLPGLPTTPMVPLSTSASRTWCGIAYGLSARYSAAAPATCGVAIDVPLMVLESVSLPIQADVMSLPGAKMSTQRPMLEKLDRASVLVVEPTLMASSVRAGELLQASAS